MYPLKSLPFKNLFPMFKALNKKLPKLKGDESKDKPQGLKKLQSLKNKFNMPKDRLESLEKENKTLNNYIEFFEGNYKGTDPLVDAKMLHFQNNIKMSGE